MGTQDKTAISMGQNFLINWMVVICVTHFFFIIIQSQEREKRNYRKTNDKGDIGFLRTIEGKLQENKTTKVTEVS